MPGAPDVARERIDLPNRAAQPGSDSFAREDFDVVTVFWGTNRRPGAPSATGQPTFAAHNAKGLSLGFAHVTIPRVDRERGTIQRPWRFASLQLEREDPKKHFTIGDLKILDTSDFISTSDAILKRSRRFKDEAFIFIHGYNTGFDDAI
jgi:esterase/lipase superfamily enzyme